MEQDSNIIERRYFFLLLLFSIVMNGLLHGEERVQGHRRSGMLISWWSLCNCGITVIIECSAGCVSGMTSGELIWYLAQTGKKKKALTSR